MVTQRTKSEWAAIVEEYYKSGQTQSAFCRDRGINIKTLGNQLRKSKRNQTIKRSNDEWIIIIEKQRASGKNRSQWCKEHGVSPDSFYSAEKRLLPKSQKASKPKFVELNPIIKIESELPKDDIHWSVKIRGDGIEIEVNSNYPFEKLTSLIERLVK